uniref:NADH-ubiquinone oxidoreductase chain 2 n=1 Tax=Opiliones sp. MT-2014 TaxID=1560019 RepID=A0A0A0RWH2_9ARAC|nr:NADH dehydrogenase subunit 2 [Opiliones sp. MT-2014]
MLKPAMTIFGSMVILGTMISISANSWFLAWFGLEMNLIGFIPLLVSKENIKSPEAAIKYFFIQGVSSSLLIITSLNSTMNFSNSTMILLALMVKMGAAPTHFWVPNLLEAISWSNSCLLLTWQKISPLFLTTLSMKNNLMFYAGMSLVLGTLLGFNQISTKKILAFSSISHLAWILSVLKLSTKILWLYFFIYALTIFLTMMLLALNNSNTINMTLTLNFPLKTNIYMLLLSLGGMPPLVGFFPKMMVISFMVNNAMLVLPLLLVMSSLVNLYFYLRLTYTMLIVHPTSNFFNSYYSSPYLLLPLIFSPIIPLLF